MFEKAIGVSRDLAKSPKTSTSDKVVYPSSKLLDTKGLLISICLFIDSKPTYETVMS